MLATLLVTWSCTAPKPIDDPPFDAGADIADAGEPGCAQEIASTSSPCVGPAFVIHPSDEVREVELAPLATHVCALTGIGGGFGASASVSVRPEPSSTDSVTRWRLRASPGLEARAQCYARGCFLGVTIVSRGGPFRGDGQPIDPFALIARPECGQLMARGWWGDAVTFIASVEGELASLGEAIVVSQSSEYGVDSTVHLRSCGANIGGSTISFFAGIVDQRDAALFAGPMGIGRASISGEYRFTMTSDEPACALPLARLDMAACFLTSISGRFAAPGDRIAIAPASVNGIETWHLFAEASSEVGVQVGARCLLFNQGSPF